MPLPPGSIGSEGNVLQKEYTLLFIKISGKGSFICPEVNTVVDTKPLIGQTRSTGGESTWSEFARCDEHNVDQLVCEVTL